LPLWNNTDRKLHIKVERGRGLHSRVSACILPDMEHHKKRFLKKSINLRLLETPIHQAGDELKENLFFLNLASYPKESGSLS
jgi:hypothetical protein